MRRLFVLAMLACASMAFAAWFTDLPTDVTRPNGKTAHLYITGDEFFNRVHNKDNYTVVRHPKDGDLYWAKLEKDQLVPSQYTIDTDPVTAGILPGVTISQDAYNRRKESWFGANRSSGRCPTDGQVNNVVVFIRFNNQSEFDNPLQTYEQKFNDVSQGAESLRSYYNEVSYGQLDITSHYYPQPAGNTILSYQDSHNRTYFQAYNAATNPNGYNGDDERTMREQHLLADAVSYVESSVPQNLNIDGDNDGRVDNVCFIIKGANDQWAELLWAHRWTLHAVESYIHNKRVWDFTFQPETQNTADTICHEMFHSIGAPDLYRYNYDANPVGNWDLMHSGFGHMGAYMKWRYGHWIDDPVTVTQNGTYQINPLTNPTNNWLRFNSPNSGNQYFVVEFRKRVPGTYEYNLPGSGLLVYRINTTADGEGNADGPPDEVYIYRPGGTPNSDGDLDNAYFSEESGRVVIGDDTDPYPFLANGSAGGLFIGNIGSSQQEQMSLVYGPENGFLYGIVSTNNPDYDLTQVQIDINGDYYPVNIDGSYLIEHAQGTYQVTASGPGLTSITEQATIEPFLLTTQNFELISLPNPTNLRYETQGTAVTLYWDFDGTDYETFAGFSVYLSLNGGPFNIFRTVSEPTLMVPFTLELDVKFYVVANYTNGTSLPTPECTIVYTDTEDTPVTPVNALLGNYPNPFNPQTDISFSQSQAGPVQLYVYNILGQKVATLVDKYMPAGQHTVTWNGTDNHGRPQAGGVYFYKIRSGRYTSTKKMILLK